MIITKVVLYYGGIWSHFILTGMEFAGSMVDLFNHGFTKLCINNI